MKYGIFFGILVFAFIPTTASAQTPRYARVIAENANLRDAPGVAGISEQEVPEGTLVKILDEKLPWYVVRVGNRVGWMHGNTIEFIGSQGSTSEPPQHQIAPQPQIAVPNYNPSPPPVRRSEPPPVVKSLATANRGYITGPRGGCYYFSGSGRKVYVDRSLCH